MSFTAKNEKVSVSFEFFPPADLSKADNFWASVEDLAKLQPAFISLTYGAGGSTRERSLEILKRLVADSSLTPVAHLTCVAVSKDEANEMARQFHEIGIRRLVVLRGDPPKGDNLSTVHPDGYANATEFMHGLNKIADFDMSLGAYPEIHPESSSMEHEIEVLKQKVDAGAKRFITQFFFDCDVYLRFVEKARAAGIDIPIIPGILPIVNFNRVRGFAESCGASIPPWLEKLFDGVEPSSTINNMLAASVLIDQCNTLYDAGVRNFHFYTLNKSELTRAVCKTLGIQAEDNEQ